LVKLIPLGPRGKRRNVSCVYRYMERGVRGIKLEFEQHPDGRRTSLEAYQRFVERLTAKCQTRTPVEIAPSRGHIKRQTAVEQEIQALRASLGRKKGGR
jgi:hypothetical protein